MKKRIIPIVVIIAFTISGCTGNSSTDTSKETQSSSLSTQSNTTKTQTDLNYKENEEPLEYDEIMLWVNDMVNEMSAFKPKTSTINKDGTIFRDYEYATILWSGETAPKILDFVMTKPSLACPRGVFVGNPIKKVLAYYKTPANPDVTKKQTFYYNENKTENAYKISYGFSKDSIITFGAIKRDVFDKYNDIRLCFDIKEDKVVRISYSFTGHSDPSESETFISSNIDK